MGKSSKRKKERLKRIQSLSENSDRKLTESERELINKTVKQIKQTVEQAVLTGSDTAFCLLTNEEKGYPKKIKKAVETRVRAMTFPINVHISLYDQK